MPPSGLGTACRAAAAVGVTLFVSIALGAEPAPPATSSAVPALSATPSASAPEPFGAPSAPASAPSASASEEAVPPPAPSALAAPELVLPAPSAAPPAVIGPPAPPPSATPEPAVVLPEKPAKIHDTVVFVVRHSYGKKSASERAATASDALRRAIETPGSEEVRVVRQGEAFVVYAGSIPVVELSPEDVEGSNYSTLETQAAAIGDRVRDSVTAEKRRSAIAGTVFSFSLLVFVGLVAFYVLRKIGEFFERARKWMVDNPDRITGLRVQSQEVIGPTALRGGALVTLIVGRFVAQVGVFYLWLVFALSLFQSTRPYTEKLTGFVVTPLSDLAARIAASLPFAVMAAVSGVTVYVLLRFVQLFFEGIARQQTVIPWLPPDLAGPTSVVVRAGVIVGALVLVAPLVTGDSNGALARAGLVVLLSLGISSTPLLGSIAVGTVTVFGRRIRAGEYAEIGGRTGRVIAVGLIDVRLRDRDGCEVRVPHLLSLVHPTRILGMRPRVAVEVVVTPDSAPAHVRQVLIDAVSALGEAAAVELTGIDADAAIYRVVVSIVPELGAGQVRTAMAEALHDAGIGLGRGAAKASAS